MNTQAIHTYGSARSPAKDPRTAEAVVLSRITARLGDADRRSGQDFPAFAAALDENRKFWSIAAIDLASDGNRLPDDLRARLLSIAAFVLDQTSRMLASGGSAAALIDINRAVISGLAAQADPT